MGTPTPRRRRLDPRESLLGIIFCIPALLGLGIFVIFPLFQAVFLTTRRTDINGDPTLPAGGENFRKLFTPEFGQVLLHTLEFTAMVVAGGVVLPLLLAVPMAQKLRGMRIFRVLFTLPFAYSAAAASVVWLLMLDPSMSPLKWVLGLVGVTSPAWTATMPWALITVALVTTWMVSGFNLLVISAGLASVDEEVLEAAKIDGSVGIGHFFRVLLPMISPHMFFVVVTTTLTALQALGQVQVITDGGPNGSTATLVYSIFDQSFHNGHDNFGLASAQGLVLLLVGILLAAVQFGVIERRVHYR